MDKFPCTACGACCKKIGQILETERGLFHPVYQEALAAFPYKPREDGSCEMLGEDNRCTVYESRPDICKIDTMIDRLGLDRKMRYWLNATTCNLLQEQAGIDPSFRVTLPEEFTDGWRL